MKKGLIFLIGIIVGAILTIILVSVNNTSKTNNNNKTGITLYKQAGEIMPYKSFQVLQVLSDGSALMHTSNKTDADYGDYFEGALVLMRQMDKTLFYDEMIITVPEKGMVRQIGTYRYEAKYGNINTIPVVQIVDK